MSLLVSTLRRTAVKIIARLGHDTSQKMTTTLHTQQQRLAGVEQQLRQINTARHRFLKKHFQLTVEIMKKINVNDERHLFYFHLHINVDNDMEMAIHRQAARQLCTHAVSRT